MSELDEIRQRLSVLEDQVSHPHGTQAQSRRAADLFAMVDRDVADISAAFGAQRQILQALHDSQIEHGKTLGEHGKTLGGLVVDVTEIRTDITGLKTDITEIRTDITGLKTDVTEIRTDITGLKQEAVEVKQTLAEHSSVLADHGNVLGAIVTQLEQHGRILARLDPGTPEAARNR